MNGQSYGIPHGRGPNLLTWNTEDAPTHAPRRAGTSSGRRRRRRRQGQRLRLVDLHRRRRAPPHDDQPDLGITNPYQLNQAQFDAAIDLLEQQRDAGALYWGTYSDQMASFTSGEVTTGTSWQFQVDLLKAEPAADRRRPAR